MSEDIQTKIDAEYAARKADLDIVRQQAQEFAAKAQQAEAMALRIDGALQQLQALGAKDPTSPITEKTPEEAAEHAKELANLDLPVGS